MTRPADMPAPSAEELIAREAETLVDLERAAPLRRIRGYMKLMGPGYMQSAMTLGGGTATASIFAGAAFGYDLLWVAPLGMLLGVIVLSAVAHQTLSTTEEPFQAMRRHAGAFFAYGWGIAAILSSIIWQFAQYALASAMLLLLAEQARLDGPLKSLASSIGSKQGLFAEENVPRMVMGVIALIWCVAVGLMYDRSPRLVRLYERILKGMVWLIVLCLAVVVVRTGVPSVSKLLAGFVPHVPAPVAVDGQDPISAVVLIASGLAAAVGVNMLFVYPYTLRRRGWGRAHRPLARYDLVLGMFVPYAIAASLLVVAAASVLHFQSPELFPGRKVSPEAVARILASPERLGPVVGVWVFGLGIIAMALSSITMQMLCSGFACETMFGWKRGTRLHVVGTLLPAIGVLGAVFWGKIAVWVAVPTNIICGLLMPIAYVGFILLQRSRAYLGKDRPEGPRAALWIAGMVVATALLVVALCSAAVVEGPGYLDRVRSLLASPARETSP
ncbi:MAG: divalent metal cation transporter [Phycisphaerales bacterium]|nr:divalent metal cation transporter [Phycisphaerales bacterium]